MVCGKGMDDYLKKVVIQRILSWGKDITEEKLSEMINRKIRVEKIAIKDVKMRTFITEDVSRNEMVQHVYDITYGTVQKGRRYTGRDRRFHRAGHHPEGKHCPDAGPAGAEKDHRRLICTTDPLPRLLWHRYEQTG